MSTQKYVLITGCSAGSIGDSVAKEFANRGYHVFATARSMAKVEHLSPNPNITPLVLDVTSGPSIAAAAAHITSATGGVLHVLFNNAGQNYVQNFADTDLASLRANYEVNVFSIYTVTQAFLPLLIAAAGSALVLNQGSMAAHINFPNTSAYASGKAAVAHLSDVMRVQFYPLGVHVKHLVTAIVKSNIYTWQPKLPPGSVYAPIRVEWEKATDNAQSSHAMAMETDLYARNLVGSVLGERWWWRRAWLWEGNLAWFTWFCYTCVPRGMLDELAGGWGPLKGYGWGEVARMGKKTR